jgi:hypothetical protein
MRIKFQYLLIPIFLGIGILGFSKLRYYKNPKLDSHFIVSEWAQPGDCFKDSYLITLPIPVNPSDSKLASNPDICIIKEWTCHNINYGDISYRNSCQ